MMRRILTLCCLGLLGGAIAAAVLAANERPSSGFGRKSVRLNTPSGNDCYLERQHSLPLLAEADETDDTEELSDREGAAGTHHANRSMDGPSPRCTRFEAAIQHRLANTLNALGVRLQI